MMKSTGSLLLQDYESLAYIEKIVILYSNFYILKALIVLKKGILTSEVMKKCYYQIKFYLDS